MASTPGITFHLPDRVQPIGPQDPRWQAPIPAQPSAFPPGQISTATAPPDDTSLSYGEYFTVIERFLARNDYRQLRRAVDQTAPSQVILDQWEIKIISEKHGALYHPARIEVSLGRTELNFVVNLALSDQGRQVLPREVENLLRLELEFELPFLPRVFGSGEVVLDDLRVLAMFLGEWFPHHYEFHLAHNPHTGKDGVHLWDPHFPGRFLDSVESRHLFRKAAYILTCYYNPLTTEQIFPWHHGAGDFIWGRSVPKGGVSVKLITVRGYQPLLSQIPDSPDVRDIVDGLVLFFLHMALRMRLDRRDGVGRIGWFGGEILRQVLKGFMEGLEFQASRYGLPDDFALGLHNYLKRSTIQDLRAMYQDLTPGASPVGGGERAVVSRGLENHIHDLQSALGD